MFDTNKPYQERIDDIIRNLYVGGGKPQCKDILKHMIDNDDIDAEDILDNISQLLKERKRSIEQDYIISLEMCDYFLKDGKYYACLDKDLKFCVIKKGSDEWNNVSHVMYKMDIGRARDLIYQHNRR